MGSCGGKYVFGGGVVVGGTHPGLIYGPVQQNSFVAPFAQQKGPRLLKKVT